MAIDTNIDRARIAPRAARGYALCLLLALAAALATLGAIAAAAHAVQITEYSLPTGSTPVFITAGPDGNLWFTDGGANKIGKITTSGAVTEYGLGITPAAGLNGIAPGPEGNIWFTERAGHKIGRITQSGAITEFSAGLTGTPDIYGITAGPGGNVWFTETFASLIGEIQPGTGAIKEIPAPAGVYTGIVQGPDGNIWYTMPDKATIARMTPSGAVSVFGPLPASDCASGAPTPCPYPDSIAVGPEGNLWFDEARGNAIGRITTSGGISEYTDGLTHGAGVSNLVAGPEGNIWFTEQSANQIGRITPSGVVTEFSSGISPGAQPLGIALGPDQNLWVTELGGKIARVIPDVPPLVATGPPATVSRSGATVTGTVRSRGADTHYAFEYGTTPAYGHGTTVGDNGNGDGVVPVSATLGGLSPNTVYHYRIVASNASGTVRGQDVAFLTPRRKHHRRRVSVGPFEMYFAGYASAGGRLRLSKIVVIGVHKGEGVAYRCLRCHGSPRHKGGRAPRARVTFHSLKLLVTAHSLLQVTVTGKDGSKRVRTYGFRIAKAESKLKKQRCFIPGHHKPVSCATKPGHHHHRHH